MRCQYSFNPEESGIVAVLSGSLANMGSADGAKFSLPYMLKQEAERAGGNLRIDMSGVEKMDMTGLAVIARIWDMIQNKFGKELVISGPSEYVRRYLTRMSFQGMTIQD